jgi:hypothetical protein
MADETDEEGVLTDEEVMEIKNHMTRGGGVQWRVLVKKLGKRSQTCAAYWTRFMQLRSEAPWTEDEDVIVQTEGARVYEHIPSRPPEAIDARRAQLLSIKIDGGEWRAMLLEFRRRETLCFQAYDVHVFTDSLAFLIHFEAVIIRRLNACKLVRTSEERDLEMTLENILREIRWWRNEMQPHAPDHVEDFTKAELDEIFEIVRERRGWPWLEIGKLLNRRSEDCRLTWISQVKEPRKQPFADDEDEIIRKWYTRDN